MENSKVLSAQCCDPSEIIFMGAEQRGLLQTKIDKRDSIHSFNRGSTKRKWMAICISRSLRLSCICSDREASLGFCSAAKASFFHWFSGYMVIGKNNNRFPVSSDFPWAVQTHTRTHTQLWTFSTCWLPVCGYYQVEPIKHLEIWMKYRYKCRYTGGRHRYRYSRLGLPR